MAEGSDESPQRKRDREPISLICLIVLLVASIVVIAAYVDDHYLSDDDEEAETGDKVTVSYTGALYDFYDNGGAVFDTNVKSVNDDAKYAKTNSYEDKTSFSTLSFTIGQGPVLAAFENAVKGHSVGDTFTVKIDAKDAYVSADTLSVMTGKTALNYSISKDTYKSEFGSDASAAATPITTSYGWPAVATLDSESGKVNIASQVEIEKTYTIVDNDAYGKASVKVTGITDGEVSYELTLDGKKTGEKFTVEGVEYETIKMIKIVDGEGTHYIKGVSTDGNSFCWKTDGSEKGEINNEDLYFTIKLESIE